MNTDPNIEFAKREILKFFADGRSRVGDSLNEGSFGFHMSRYWNPKQQDSFEAAIDELVAEGLVELKNDGVYLTQKGYDAIY